MGNPGAAPVSSLISEIISVMIFSETAGLATSCIRTLSGERLFAAIKPLYTESDLDFPPVSYTHLPLPTKA